MLVSFLIWIEKRAYKKATSTFALQRSYLIRQIWRREGTSLDELQENPALHHAKVLVAKELTPEEEWEKKEMIEELLRAMQGKLTRTQLRLIARHIVDQIPFVDLKEETGRSDGALRTAMHAIRRRMQELVGSGVISAAEVDELLALLARPSVPKGGVEMQQRIAQMLP